jgi:hypothetical protein
MIPHPNFRERRQSAVRRKRVLQEVGQDTPPSRDRLSCSLDTKREPPRGGAVTYLRCTIGRWNIDLDSEEGREVFRLIDAEGVRVFRSQPGFVR